MGYIGKEPAASFTSLEKQDLTGASGTSLTLNHSVTSANDIALYINNVRQEPTEAYSVNGQSVSLTGSVVSSDDIYVIFLARALQSINPIDGSVSTDSLADSAVSTAKLSDTAITGAKLPTGSIIQAVQDTIVTSQQTTSETFTDVTGLSITITPTATTSKILLSAQGIMQSGGGWFGALTIDRNGTNIGLDVGSHSVGFSQNLLFMQRDHAVAGGTENFAFQYMDSPSSTSALTYKLQFAVKNGGTMSIGRRSNDTGLASPTYLTAMEVVA